MVVTGWLESLRAAEKTALLQDGNSRPRASSLLSPRVRPSAPAPPGRAAEPGPQSWKGRGRRPSQVLVCRCGN